MLRPSGGYRQLLSFQAATAIYDATVSFCGRFLERRSRTIDQMVQAARSGRQNIAEGSRASGASSQTELRLLNVARASLDALLLDYEDFLRQRGLPQWTKDGPQAREVREVGRKMKADRTDRSYPTDRSDRKSHPTEDPYARWIASEDPAVVANTLITLIHQANYLLDRQIAALEQEFIRKGGYTEQLATARIEERRKQQQPESAEMPPRQVPRCPVCGGQMTLRTARRGKLAGSRFWGCADYPRCTGTRPARTSE